MNSPSSHVEPGFFMSFSVRDFASPASFEEVESEVDSRQVHPNDTQDSQQVWVPQVSGRTETTHTSRYPRKFMDEEYPEWVDDIPPWRNPDPGGEKYLYVWQQHEARIRGHH